MKKGDRGKTKLYIFLASLLLTLVSILLFFLDNSLGWNVEKIVSCVVVNLWIFFVIPAIRNSYLVNEGKSLGEWFKMGFHFGASGIAYPILFAPYYGVKYYFNL